MATGYAPPLTALAKLSEFNSDDSLSIARHIAQVDLFMGSRAEPGKVNGLPYWTGWGMSDPRRLPEQEKRRAMMAAVALSGVTTSLDDATPCVWRGDILDAAIRGGDAFEGERFDQATFSKAQAAAYVYLMDPYGPVSVTWSRWQEDIARAYKSMGVHDAPRYSLRAMFLAAVGQEEFDRRFRDPEMRAVRAKVAQDMGASPESDLRGPDAARMLAAFLMEHPRDGTRLAMLNFHLPGEIMRGATCELYASAVYMGLPFVGRERMERNRGLGRWPRRGSEPAVNRVVLFRRPKSSEEPIGGESGRVYTCQWEVGGHFRRLSKPRKADGAAVTYVRPYVKGPEDAPLRASGRVIRSVKR